MNDLAERQLASPQSSGASQRGVDERSRTHALPFIFWLLEQNLITLLAIPAVFAGVVTLVTRGPWWVFVLALLAIPGFGIVLPLLYLAYRSSCGACSWANTSSRAPTRVAHWGL